MEEFLHDSRKSKMHKCSQPLAREKFYCSQSGVPYLPWISEKNLHDKCAFRPLMKGFVLVPTLMLAVLIVSASYCLFATTILDSQITRNTRMYHRAKFNAQSGLASFVARGYHYEDIDRILGGRESVVVEKGKITKRDSYEVRVKALEQDKFEVVSNGFVEKLGKKKASASVVAIFQSVWSKN